VEGVAGELVGGGLFGLFGLFGGGEKGEIREVAFFRQGEHEGEEDDGKGALPHGKMLPGEASLAKG
jgi:hypothetical protein